MIANIQDGYSNDELLSIGTRRTKLDLNISATDINSPIPHCISQMECARMSGLSDNELKNIAEGKSTAIALPSSDTINSPFNNHDMGAVEIVLDGLQRFLGIRTK